MSLKRIHELSDVKSFYDENGYLIIDDFISEFEANNLKYLLEKHASADYNNMLNMDRYEFLVAQSLEKIKSYFSSNLRNEINKSYDGTIYEIVDSSNYSPNLKKSIALGVVRGG